VLAAIFGRLGTTNQYFVEFGCQDASECNSALLLEQGWTGLLMDRDASPELSVRVQREVVTADNINVLLDKYEVPGSFDLLSIDIDGNDYWVWKAMQRRPRVVVIEYNAHVPPESAKVIAYDPDFEWAGTSYFGASLRALSDLGASKGYTLIYCEQAGVNAFFVSDDLVAGNFLVRDVVEVYRPPNYFYRGLSHPADSRSMMDAPKV
jgi:hypothetical protein